MSKVTAYGTYGYGWEARYEARPQLTLRQFETWTIRVKPHVATGSMRSLGSEFVVNSHSTMIPTLRAFDTL